jgi:hypothetical protein
MGDERLSRARSARPPHSLSSRDCNEDPDGLHNHRSLWLYPAGWLQQKPRANPPLTLGDDYKSESADGPGHESPDYLTRQCSGQFGHLSAKRRVETAKHEVQFSERTGRDISFPFWRKIHFRGTKNREISSSFSKPLV